MAAHLAYAVAWLSFGVGHSVLASGRGRGWLVGRFGPAHRVAYNGIALVHILAVALVGWWALGDRPPFDLPGGLRASLHGATVLGVVLLVAFARSYDSGRLLGTAQLQGRGEDEDERLSLDGVHRWVRHPLYLAALVILWSRAVDPFGLATAVWGSLYLGIGAWFEERKLLARHGAAYGAYRARVPMLVPWKGRAWPPPAGDA